MSTELNIAPAEGLSENRSVTLYLHAITNNEVAP
jgi:hypothetical protein